MSIVVSDTSPIRALAHLNHLDLLHTLFVEVLIPPAVVSELEQPRSRFTVISIGHLEYIRISAPTNRAVVDQLRLTLGAGEAEALALAAEVGAEAILIDESAGRAAAKRLGLLPLGVLGILLRAHQRKLIGPLRPLLDQLQKELGFFISPAVRTEILRNAEEFEFE